MESYRFVETGFKPGGVKQQAGRSHGTRNSFIRIFIVTASREWINWYTLNPPKPGTSLIRAPPSTGHPYAVVATLNVHSCAQRFALACINGKFSISLLVPMISVLVHITTFKISQLISKRQLEDIRVTPKCRRRTRKHALYRAICDLITCTIRLV